jgi:hypothetical protein
MCGVKMNILSENKVRERMSRLKDAWGFSLICGKAIVISCKAINWVKMEMDR